MRRTVLLAWLAFSLAAAAPSASHAQSPQDLLRAQKLYDEGDKLEQAGDAAQALAKFEEALTVVETAQLRLRAGRCQEKLGRLVESLESYKRAVALSEEDATLNKVASDQARAAAGRVPKLALKKPSNAPPDVSLTVDGKTASFDEPVFVNPGEHVVVAEAAGHQRFEKRAAAREGDTVTIAVELVANDKPKEAEGKPTPVLPWVLIGGGAAFLGASIGLGAASASSKSTAYDDLAGPAGCTPGDPPGCPWASAEAAPKTPAVEEFLGKIDEANVFLGLAIGAGVIAAGAGATGVVLLVTGGDEAPATALPWFDERGGGVAVVGRF
ncbi:MAG: tetratricopeptide repeat protein [Myxococcales bacterium]|nr:tetratricopeptide repeat protein [Myxococcales bacterium]